MPFESDPTVWGSTDAFDLADDGTTIDVHASFPTFDIDGNPEGDADLTFTLARTGDVRLIVPDTGKTNYNSKTSGMEEGLEGSGTLMWDGSEIAVARVLRRCWRRGFLLVPTLGRSVSTNTGVQVDCIWEAESSQARSLCH